MITFFVAYSAVLVLSVHGNDTGSPQNDTVNPEYDTAITVVPLTESTTGCGSELFRDFLQIMSC